MLVFLVIHPIKRDNFLNGPSRCPLLNQISHTKWPCLIKLVILIWLTSLLIMPTKLLTYLLNIYLLKHIHIYPPNYLFIYLHNYLFIYIPTYLLSTYLFIYLHTYIYLPTYISTYILTYISKYIHLKT